jgi:hypothetical protein
VPLHAEDERVGSAFDAFNEAVGSDSVNRQIFSELADGLVMRGINLETPALEDPVQ